MKTFLSPPHRKNTKVPFSVKTNRQTLARKSLQLCLTSIILVANSSSAGSAGSEDYLW